ncbi:MAG: hypothetical protein K6F74_01430 [Prevotella sp.]|nr:hypothetical protein [Prevotella sp.]
MRNKHGIEVRECCASCKHKDLTKFAASRFCLMHHKKVKPREWCEQWKMSEQLEAAGSSGGKIKKQAYLKYLMAVREDESLADQLKVQYPHKSIEQIRREFEEKNGSIYVEP